MPKTYTIDIAYGKYYSDEGTFVSLCVPQSDEADTQETLAELLSITPDNPDFDWDIQTLTLPQELVEQIQRDARS